QKIDNTLSECLCEIEFGDCFNQVISTGTLPISLRRITFGWNFNQPVRDMLTHLLALDYLEFGNDFKQKSKNIQFPINLKQVNFKHLITDERKNVYSVKEVLNLQTELKLKTISASEVRKYNKKCNKKLEQAKKIKSKKK